MIFNGVMAWSKRQLYFVGPLFWRDPDYRKAVFDEISAKAAGGAAASLFAVFDRYRLGYLLF